MELIRKALINSYTKVTWVTLSILMSYLTVFQPQINPLWTIVGWSLYLVWPFYTCPTTLNKTESSEEFCRSTSSKPSLFPVLIQAYMYLPDTLPNKDCLCSFLPPIDYEFKAFEASLDFDLSLSAPWLQLRLAQVKQRWEGINDTPNTHMHAPKYTRKHTHLGNEHVCLTWYIGFSKKINMLLPSMK